MLGRSMLTVIGLSLALGSSAFMAVPRAGNFVGATRRASSLQAAGQSVSVLATGGSLLNGLRARQWRREVATATMDTEHKDVSVVKSDDQWHELMAATAESGSTLVVLFKKDFCRKCAAMKPKFAKLARAYSGRGVVWAEVDGVKLGKALRTELKLAKVPSFQIWGQGRVLEHFDADMDLSQTVLNISELVDKHSGGAGAVPADNLLLRDLNRFTVAKEMSNLQVSTA
mmetsp:Transcript_27850/g.40979  ORF Transcript_27850/g.40979 Transcript_27850/m.40979 type:complete len:228 (-) Transcript_27850:37-720(-)|eukprot:CAMPEP_0179452184 /NCGR_PEP_ID=MMETSP0799-20121207/36092_1 /TAXON_ID=46947 /ORGANISM="Geminigera cryophila, Strain CCMP2564" /LENGTH=227 /DNA_ID=CAMNT_0021247897 /DNA_START=178 /DNA_END=861 /DNA_ORIENTATION=-